MEHFITTLRASSKTIFESKLNIANARSHLIMCHMKKQRQLLLDVIKLSTADPTA